MHHVDEPGNTSNDGVETNRGPIIKNKDFKTKELKSAHMAR